MATARPFAYNTGTTIPDMSQSGDLAIAPLTGSTHRLDLQYGEVTWYMGCDEELGYVIARPNSPLYRPRFLRCAFTEQAYLDLVNYISEKESGPGPFDNTLAAKNWINSAGFWQTYTGGTGGVGVELFRFNVTGTTVNFLRVAGTSLDAGDSPEWDFGDTETADTINSTFSHTYTGGYVAPAEKTISFTLTNPTDATTLFAYGGSPAAPNSVIDIVLSGFTSLETLYVQNNPLSVLDLSNNSNLKYLSIGGTELTSFDGTDTPGLLTLSVGPNTNLTSLDISANSSLTSLTANGTGLSSLDVTNNPALTNITAYNNSISTLDVSNNTALSNLFVYSTNLSTLDLSNNTVISAVYANLCNISSLTFDTGATYASLGQFNIADNNMTAGEVNDFIDLLWLMRTKFTSGYITGVMGGSNADMSFLSTHKLMYLHKDYGYSDFGSQYNIPDNIMRFGWTSAGPYDSNVSSYFLLQSSNSPSKAALYGNSITSATGAAGMTWNVYCDTNLTDFQSSDVRWTVAIRYRKHTTDSYTIADNSTYVFTGNTSGMELQNTVSASISGITGSQTFQMDYQITLTDNRADKTQDTGDAMVLRVVPAIEENSWTDGLVVYPYDTITQNFTRTKWGA